MSLDRLTDAALNETIDDLTKRYKAADATARMLRDKLAERNQAVAILLVLLLALGGMICARLSDDQTDLMMRSVATEVAETCVRVCDCREQP